MVDPVAAGSDVTDMAGPRRPFRLRGGLSLLEGIASGYARNGLRAVAGAGVDTRVDLLSESLTVQNPEPIPFGAFE